VGVAFSNWEALKPDDERTLTQLGGCALVDTDGRALYAWLDDGICDTADFDDMLQAL